MVLFWQIMKIESQNFYLPLMAGKSLFNNFVRCFLLIVLLNLDLKLLIQVNKISFTDLKTLA